MLNNEHLFSNVGIDSIGFYAPRLYLKLEDLAKIRNIDPNKYKHGLLLREMRIPDFGEDIVSMGLKAGYNALLKGGINPKKIDAVFVGTETITYAVKSISNILAELLGISINSITQDTYNACAAATLSIINAIGLIEKEVINRALVIGADISYYELGSPGEPTQGAGAIAMVISKNPRVAVFSKKFGKISSNIDDFFRPAESKVAQVFGKYSTESYLRFQLGAYDDLVKNIGDFTADYYTFHAPYSKLPLKCIQQIILKRWTNNIEGLLKLRSYTSPTSIIRKIDSIVQNVSVVPDFILNKLKKAGLPISQIDIIKNRIFTIIKHKVLPQLRVPMNFGNMYSASVWSQIFYILERFANPNDTIYFGSYGSGATCLAGLLKVLPSFRKIVDKRPRLIDYFNNKIRKTVKEYEDIRMGNYTPEIYLGQIKEHELNKNRGFILTFCDEGCIIPPIKGLNYCPKGHSGFHRRFFPLIAELVSEPIKTDVSDLSFLKNKMVRILGRPTKGNILEYEFRRVDIPESEDIQVKGLLSWAPTYIPIYDKASPYI
ncbi:MAG: hydroxymethylglutaryl-CoA synthase family protein [Candidatus Helarchaeota archaeon]